MVSVIQFRSVLTVVSHTGNDSLYVQVTVHRDNLPINNEQAHQVSKILFCHETLHVSGIYCAHHQELSAVHVPIGMFHA
jgi:hypothetical protein